MLYEDPQLGFCVLAHSYNGPKNSPPHDHGPSWAIYGQAKGETEMTDYELVAPAADGKPGKARPVRTYKLTPGVAYLYNEGDLHSPLRRGPTQLIRIEGMNMDRIKRLKFEFGQLAPYASGAAGCGRFAFPSARDPRVERFRIWRCARLRICQHKEHR